MPFFIIAGGIGLIDLVAPPGDATATCRSLALGGIVVVAVYCIAANVAIAAFPVSQWTMAQSARFLSVQKSLSIGSLADRCTGARHCHTGHRREQIFAMNNCSGLYLSTGNDMKDVPGQQIEHYTWMPVEQSVLHPGHRIHLQPSGQRLDPARDPHDLWQGQAGHRTVPHVAGDVQIELYNSGTSIGWPSPISWKFPITAAELHKQLQIAVTVDPNLNRFLVTWYDNQTLINHYVAGSGPVVIQQTTITREVRRSQRSRWQCAPQCVAGLLVRAGGQTS